MRFARWRFPPTRPARDMREEECASCDDGGDQARTAAGPTRRRRVAGRSMVAFMRKLSKICSPLASCPPSALEEHEKKEDRQHAEAQRSKKNFWAPKHPGKSFRRPSAAHFASAYPRSHKSNEDTFRTTVTHRESHGRRGEGGPPEAAGQEDDQDHRQGLESAARRALHPGHLPGAGGRCR